MHGRTTMAFRPLAFPVVLFSAACLFSLPSTFAAELPLAKGDKPVLRIQGAETVVSVLTPELVSGFLKKEGFTNIARKDTRDPLKKLVTADAHWGSGHTAIELYANGTDYGLQNLAAGIADISAADQQINTAEPDGRKRTGPALEEHVIAVDGIAIIVNKVNPLSFLSADQLAGLFSGDVKNWSAVGGPSWPVHVHALDDNAGATATIDEYFLHGRDKQLTIDAQVAWSSEELAKNVGQDPNGIGFVNYARIENNKALGVADGGYSAISATAESIATEDYPLTRRVYFYTSESNHNAWTEALMRFVQSPEGQAIVARSGFVSQEPQAFKVKANHNMSPEYRDLVQNAQRLSVNFRFPKDSAQLDDKGRHDLARVVDYVRGHNVQHFALAAFGSASEGNAHAMASLRALTIRRALHKGGILTTDIRNFSDTLPVAVDGTDQGTYLNQRVEIWIYPNTTDAQTSASGAPQP